MSGRANEGHMKLVRECVSENCETGPSETSGIKHLNKLLGIAYKVGRFKLGTCGSREQIQI